MIISPISMTLKETGGRGGGASILKSLLRLLKTRSTFGLSPTIRSLATGKQLSGPMKSKHKSDWFLVVTDRIVRLSPKVDQGL